MNGGRQAGLTLVETLTALTIMGVTLALLFDGLYVIGRSARAGQEQLAGNDRARVAWAFLRREVSEAVPLSRGQPAEAPLFFDGGPAELRFFGELPAHRGGGGVYEMRLTRREDDSGAHLVLSYRNAWPERLAAPERAATWATVSLVENVRSLALAYFGRESADSPERWHDRWVQRAVLPERVRIAVEFDDGRRWPELVIPIRVRSPAVQAHFIALPEPAGSAT